MTLITKHWFCTGIIYITLLFHLTKCTYMFANLKRMQTHYVE